MYNLMIFVYHSLLLSILFAVIGPGSKTWTAYMQRRLIYVKLYVVVVVVGGGGGGAPQRIT